MRREFNTENQIYPVCPWCGEEFDSADLDFDVEDVTLEGYHLSIDVICPSCNRSVEVTANLVYTTYKSEDNIEDIDSLEEMYDEDIDYDYE